MLVDLPSVPLMQLPTPIHALPSFTAWLGTDVEVWIKRDDLTGMAMGGNKLRKLSYLLAEAQSLKATDLVTTGAAQSNHCRQTAGAAAATGFGCHLVLRGGPADRPGGNLILDQLFGAEIHWAGAEDTSLVMADLAQQLSASGKRPYLIPLGGSTAIGAAGYTAAWMEMSDQAQSQGLAFDSVVFATSSGGTQAGLSVGAGGTDWRGNLVGISVDHSRDHLTAVVSPLAEQTARLLKTQRIHEVSVYDDYVGEGYGVVGEREKEAIYALAWSEGLLVDPVYTGRALAGLIDLSRMDRLHGRVLFWHTGGIPALFAYQTELSLS